MLLTVLFEGEQCTLDVNPQQTIEYLKLHLFGEFEVEPRVQELAGWEIEPEDDDTRVSKCFPSVEEPYLVLQRRSAPIWNQGNPPQQTETGALFETDSCLSFLSKYRTAHPYCCTDLRLIDLTDLIRENTQLARNEWKCPLLYLHNGSSRFSAIFCSLLSDATNAPLFRPFRLVGWDVESPTYHSALKKSLLANPPLDSFQDMISDGDAGLFLLLPTGDAHNFTIFTHYTGSASAECICDGLSICAEALQDLVSAQDGGHSYDEPPTYEQSQEQFKEQQEEDEQDEEEIVVDAPHFQLMMAKRLMDRDYDCFECTEHVWLKQKIGFAFFGPPQDETTLGYDDKQTEEITRIYNVIKTQSNTCSKDKDQIVVAFIYICEEPRDDEKAKRLKKNPDYDPKTDFQPHPVFVLRKCMGSETPCRIIIDHQGRVYSSWTKYLLNNKLPECTMLVPTDGRYQCDSANQLMIHRVPSPACGFGSKVLQATDVGSMVSGIASGGVFLAAAIPAVVVAPAALVTAGVVGAGVGLYSLGRSIGTLVDRAVHKESMELRDREARAAYLNLVAGTMGIVGAGSSLVVSQLVSTGTTMGQGARFAINAINVTNLGAGGLSLANNTYDVLYQWIQNDTPPSTLSMVQLTSSILFFSNAAYNFRTAGTIIDEVQARSIQEYSEGLRSNRHRRTFTKLVKATISQNEGNAVKGRSEVLASISRIGNKDEVFAFLTRSNKMFNKMGVKVVAQGKQFTINGIQVDLNSMTGYSARDMPNVIKNLQPNTAVRNNTSSDITVRSLLTDITPTGNQILQLVLKMGFSSAKLEACLVETATILLVKLQANIVGELRSILGRSFNNSLLDMILRFIAQQASSMERQYMRWRRTNSPDDYSPIFEYIKFDSKAFKIVNLMDCYLRRDFVNCSITQEALKSLIGFAVGWFAKLIYNREVEQDRDETRRQHSAGRGVAKTHCKECGGHYFAPTK